MWDVRKEITSNQNLTSHITIWICFVLRASDFEFVSLALRIPGQ